MQGGTETLVAELRSKKLNKDFSTTHPPIRPPNRVCYSHNDVFLQLSRHITRTMTYLPTSSGPPEWILDGPESGIPPADWLVHGVVKNEVILPVTLFTISCSTFYLCATPTSRPSYCTSHRSVQSQEPPQHTPVISDSNIMLANSR